MTNGLYAKTGFDYRALPINKNGKRMKGKHAPHCYICFLCGLTIDGTRGNDVRVLARAHEKTDEHKIRYRIASKAETAKEIDKAFRKRAWVK